MCVGDPSHMAKGVVIRKKKTAFFLQESDDLAGIDVTGLDFTSVLANKLFFYVFFKVFFEDYFL